MTEKKREILVDEKREAEIARLRKWSNVLVVVGLAFVTLSIPGHFLGSMPNIWTVFAVGSLLVGIACLCWRDALLKRLQGLLGHDEELDVLLYFPKLGRQFGQYGQCEIDSEREAVIARLEKKSWRLLWIMMALHVPVSLVMIFGGIQSVWFGFAMIPAMVAVIFAFRFIALQARMLAIAWDDESGVFGFLAKRRRLFGWGEDDGRGSDQGGVSSGGDSVLNNDINGGAA